MYRKYYRTMKRDGDVTETMSLGDWLDEYRDGYCGKYIKALEVLDLVEQLDNYIDMEKDGAIDGDELYDWLRFDFDDLVEALGGDDYVQIESDNFLDKYVSKTDLTVDEEIESIFENASESDIRDYIRKHVTDHLGWVKVSEIDDEVDTRDFKNHFKEFIVLDED